jgi:hypothetical protein
MYNKKTKNARQIVCKIGQCKKKFISLTKSRRGESLKRERDKKIKYNFKGIPTLSLSSLSTRLSDITGNERNGTWSDETTTNRH